MPKTGPIARHVMMRILWTDTDKHLREAEGCYQAAIAQKLGANELATVRTAIIDRACRLPLDAWYQEYRARVGL